MPEQERAEQEQQVSRWSQSLKARIHIFSYVLASIFLYIEGGRISNEQIQIGGILFLIPAFLILIAQRRAGIVKRAAKLVDDISLRSLYIIAIVIFIKEVFNWANLTNQIGVLWAIPIVLFTFIVYDIIDTVKNTRTMVRSMGKKETAIKQLKTLSFVLIFFTMAVLLANVQGIGRPVFWLIPAVIALMIALFLDGTFKRSSSDI